jgi:ElaB/YqjD/DUF883 family membrane-anchored ribosome-binding protein
MTTSQEAFANKTAAMRDTAMRGAAEVVDDTKRAVGQSVDALSKGIDQVRADAAPALRELAGNAEDLARSGAHAVRERALHLRDASAGYVRGHPLQTVLIAAGVGAVLALMTRMFTHRNGHWH